ncbi:MAG: hypothetical protein HOE86_23485, partial [Gemmatimonadetes bacterium]|nr:hypothetical protein [Gemmatimonadota bacterium]
LAPDAVTPIVPDELTDELRPEFQPGDTASYSSTLQDLYRTGNLELGDGRLHVLPLVDVDSEAGQRRNHAEQIIAQAIEAMGGLKNLQAICDKKIRREIWDNSSSTWVPNGTLYYRRGLQYLEDYQRDDGSRIEARGFDGRRSWSIRYGLHRPPRDERHNADRWDFLTRFRGDGIIAEYVGQRQVQGKVVEAIRIIDTKYNRQRLAYFNVRNHLLSSETENGTTTHYVEYRQTGDVLTPFEIAVARPCFGCISRYRWHTELNLNLTPDLLAMPPPITWDPEMVHKAIFEHADVPEAGPTSLRLRLEPLTISINPATGGPYMNGIDSYQLSEFMTRKLRQAGVLANDGALEDGSADFRALWNVDEFFGRRRATIRFTVVVQDGRLDGGQWVGRIEYSWKPQGAAVDDRHADGLTYLVISQISAGMAQLGQVAVPQESP